MEIKEFKVGITVVFIILVSIISVLLIYDMYDNYIDVPKYTMTFKSINATVLREFINTKENFTIIDCREGCTYCQFKSGHIPRASLAKPTVNYYNYTNDLLFYDVTGDGESINYCNALVGYVYGELYYLEGGWNAWK